MQQFLRKFFSIIVTICAVCPASAQINTDQVLRIGQNALYFDDYMLSIQYFNQVIAAKPYLAKPYFFRAIAKFNLEDYAGAESDASMALERNPFITDAWEVRGVARQNLGRTAEAIADYDQALKLLPDNRNILFNKALAQQDVKDYDGASASFEELIRSHPNYDNAYMGRARLYLATGDTVAALADLNRTLELNKNATNAYVMRADIEINRDKDYQAALADMDEAIKLQPKFAGFFVNRAFLRYNLDNYFGAMADYDYAIQLDPANPVAYFNRGLLRAEVSDNDRAIADFSRVLEFDPDDYRSLYNRAILYKSTRNYDRAIADISRVIDAYPDFPAAVFTRFEIYDEMGRKREAERDYRRALALSRDYQKQLKEGIVTADASASSSSSDASDASEETEISREKMEQLVSNRFSSLLTIDNDTRPEEDYNNKSIRGRVQDRNITIDVEPMFFLSYYNTTSELKEKGYYIADVDEINASRQLRFLLQVTNHAPALSDESIARQHFNSIDYYNGYLATHTPRAVDFFGRAMDFMTMRDYEAAIKDFSRAIELTPDWSLPYLMRSVARYNARVTRNKAEADNADPVTQISAEVAAATSRAEMSDILADIDRVIELSPRMPFAYFNKADMLLEAGDLTSAIAAFTRAIELKPDFGEAYYNRGYAYMKLGNKDAGTADLSKAGELGILPSYNLLKRMNR